MANELTREQIDRAQSRWQGSDYLTGGESTALFAMARAYLDATERQQAGYACAMCPDLAQARIERATARAALGRCRSVLRDIEWTPDLDGDSYCPSCGRYERRGHRDDCALAAALKGTDHV